MKDYKVEWKPSWWHVTLRSGAYTGIKEEHLFFCANSQYEVWNFLCRYLEKNFNSVLNTDGYSTGIIWGNLEKKG